MANPDNKKVKVGKKVPDFNVAVTGGEQWIKLGDLKGKNVILYFYPKDNTSGCTREGEDFAALHSQFKKAKTLVFGVSRDSLASHEKFKAKFEFPFELISDKDETLCGIFDVIKEKNMYGRKVLGVVRSTFAISANGVLVKEWRNIKVPGHAQDVLDFVKGEM